MIIDSSDAGEVAALPCESFMIGHIPHELLTLVRWGSKQFDMFNGLRSAATLMMAPEPICPHCMEFSYFCARDGLFSKKAAQEWRQAVVSFVPLDTPTEYAAGVVTIECPVCTHLFGFTISRSVIPAYQSDCPHWPRTETVIASESPELKRKISLLRQAAAFPHGHLSDIEFLVEHEKREASSQAAETV